MIVMKDIKLMFNILNVYINFTIIYLFAWKIQKCKTIQKLIVNLYDKEEYVIHIRNLI